MNPEPAFLNDPRPELISPKHEEEELEPWEKDRNRKHPDPDSFEYEYQKNFPDV
jgi:hypothetical protein